MSLGSAAPIDERERLEFLKAQLAYFTTHLSVADAKAGGILLFAAGMSAETAKGIHAIGTRPWLSEDTLGLVALALSLLAVLFALRVLVPRTTPGRVQVGGGQVDVFSWMGVANRHAHGSHIERTRAATSLDFFQGLADTNETLALVIDRKYREIRRGFWTLGPATLFHVVYWVVA